MIKVDKKIVLKLLMFLFVFFVCIPSFRLFDHFKVNDLDFHIKRLDGLVHAIDNFNFPYRINNVGNIGYGGADPIMYPYLILYIPSLLYQIFNNYNIAFNIFYILINIFTALIMYYSTYEIFCDKNIAFMATVMEILSFYRMWEVYVGACVGQYIAIMFMPLVAEGYVNVLRGKYTKWIDVFIGLSLMLQSHVVTVFYVEILLIVLTILFVKKIISDKKKIFAIIKIVIMVFLVNLWYIVPFVQYYASSKIITPHVGFPWKQVSKLNFIDHIVLTYKIILNNICFDIFDEAKIHMKISYMAVFLIIFVLFFVICKLMKNMRRDKGFKHIYSFDDKVVMVFLIIFAFNLMVSSGIFTRTFFGKVNILQKFFAIQQFEHREIVRGEVLLYMACSYIIEKYIKNKVIIKSIVCLFGVVSLIGLYTVIFSSSKIYDNCYEFVNSDYMLKGTVDGDIRDKIKLEYKYALPKDIFNGDVRVDNDNIVISSTRKVYNGYELSYEIVDDSEHVIEVPLFNYDGYVVYDGKKKIKHRTGKNALISIPLKNRSGNIKVKFEEKKSWFICDIISLLTIIGLVVVKSIVYIKYKNNKKEGIK